MCAFPRSQDQLRAMRINKPDDGGDPVTAIFGALGACPPPAGVPERASSTAESTAP